MASKNCEKCRKTKGKDLQQILECGNKCGNFIHKTCYASEKDKDPIFFCESCWDADQPSTKLLLMEIRAVRTKMQDLEDVKTKLNSIDNKISMFENKITGIEEKVKELENNYEFVSQKYDDLVDDVGVVKQLEKDNKATKSTQSKLQQEVKEVKEELLKSQLLLHANEIIIGNMPMLDNEDLEAIITQTARVLDVNIIPEDIHMAKRLGKGTEKNPYPPILVQFVHADTRNLILKTKRDRQGLIQTNACDPDKKNFGLPAPGDIYINPNWPEKVRKLFFRARQLKKYSTLRQVYINGGKVYAREHSESTAIEIEDQEMIKYLLTRYALPFPDENKRRSK